MGCMATNQTSPTDYPSGMFLYICALIFFVGSLRFIIIIFYRNQKIKSKENELFTSLFVNISLQIICILSILEWQSAKEQSIKSKRYFRKYLHSAFDLIPTLRAF